MGTQPRQQDMDFDTKLKVVSGGIATAVGLVLYVAGRVTLGGTPAGGALATLGAAIIGFAILFLVLGTMPEYLKGDI